MNDAPEPGFVEEAPKLRQWLADLAATTREDPDAWTKFQLRLVHDPARRALLKTRNRWRLVAIAAAVVLTAIAVTRTDPGRQFFTGDDEKPTTTDHDASTTTSTAGPESSTTSFPPSDQPPGGLAPPTPDTTTPIGPGTPGAIPPAPNQGNPANGSTTSTTIPTSPVPVGPTAPDGRPIGVTYTSPTSTIGLAATAWSDTGYPNALHINLWMVEPYRVVTTRQFSPGLGQNCLTSATFGFGSGNDEHHVSSFGFVRSDTAEVRVVLANGETTAASIGAEVIPGLRMWLVEHGEGDVDRLEARASNGDLLRCT